MKNKHPFQEMNTERLYLRQLVTSDWKEVSFLRSDPVINQFVIRPAAETKEKALAFIAKISKGVEAGELYYWTISLAHAPTMIGAISLWHFSENQLQAEVGYDLHPDFQGEGIMNEALDCVMKFGFETLHLLRIQAFTQYNNQSSWQLLERNGFQSLPEIKDPNNPDNVVYVKHRK